MYLYDLGCSTGGAQAQGNSSSRAGQDGGAANSHDGWDDAAPDRTQAAHNEDFHTVHWFGTEYHFTHTQAACVKALWQAWLDGTPEVSGQTILEAADSSSNRLSQVFGRNQPAWRTMIVRGEKKGTYRLNVPEKRRRKRRSR